MATNNGYDFVINCTDGVCDESEYDYGINMTEMKKAEAEGTIAETAAVLHAANMADVKEYAKFVMTLNHLLWDHYNKGDEKTARIYDALWRKYDGFAYKHFKGDDLKYYVNYLDEGGEIGGRGRRPRARRCLAYAGGHFFGLGREWIQCHVEVV